MNIRWTRPALRDLYVILEYVARENPPAAASLLARIEDRVATLVAHPEIGRPGCVVGTRELVISNTPFLVAYRLRQNEIEILAVLHGSRRWPERFP